MQQLILGLFQWHMQIFQICVHILHKTWITITAYQVNTWGLIFEKK